MVHSPLGVSLIPRWRLNNIDSRDATIKIASCRNAVQGTQPEEILEIIHPSIESGVEAEMEKRDWLEEGVNGDNILISDPDWQPVDVCK